ncbi:hypothetical protein BASA81_002652 [Batrachochytrium salamandrivorans]|nr:hypothetical protein BASA81_002652 [Batrachochytrium salamandrivorans]
MTNQSVRGELLDIFEDLTDKIDEGTYLRALNLLARIDVENHSLDTFETFVQVMDRLDGISEPLGSRVIGENFLVTRPDQIFPILNQEECEFLLRKFETDAHWRRLINNEETYIFNKETMRFVLRSSVRGKEIAKRCNLQQFPDLYTVNPRTGRLVIRRVN